MKHFKRVIICFFLIAGAINAVPLHNWRFPFFRLAAERDEATSSPSGMFWDDISFAPVMNAELWTDTGAYSINHWTLEPAVSFDVANEEFLSGKKSNLHFDILNDFRFRKLTVRNVIDVDQSYKYDPKYVWHKRGDVMSGRIQEAYLKYTGKRGFVNFGRLNRNWGPFCDRSIILSDNPFSYDALEWQIHNNFFEFRHIFAAFPLNYSFVDTDSTKINRYFAAHMLNFMMGKWATIGISETVVFSRERGIPDFQYINPFTIYFVTNTNGEGSGNIIVGVHGTIHPFTEKVSLKWQLVLDDLQVDNKTAKDQEPTHWACDLGFYWRDPFRMPVANNLSLEYRYLSRWIYTVPDDNRKIGEKYSYLDKSLGYGMIDGDEAGARISLIGKNYWAAEAGIRYRRNASNTIDSMWHDTLTPDALGYRNEKPLSRRGSLERTINLFIEGLGYFRNFCTIRMGLENRFIKNRGNESAGRFEYDPKISLTVTAHYSNFFLKFDGRDRNE